MLLFLGYYRKMSKFIVFTKIKSCNLNKDDKIGAGLITKFFQDCQIEEKLK